MALTTVTVSIDVEQCVGTPLPNARVDFELTGADFDGAIVVSQRASATCNASGIGSISLWPNARGSQGTQYKITVFDQYGGFEFSGLATVPASNCDLHAILTTPAPATVSDAQAAANAAQASAALAKLWAVQTDAEVVVGQGYGAKKYAADAATSAATAGTQASTATTQAQTATNKAGEASTSASNAAASATQAEDARDAALAGLGAADQSPNLVQLLGAAALNTDLIGQLVRNTEAHEADVVNPHAVTKAQVGLGSADNTSDADKPVSTAQAAADAAVQAGVDANVDRIAQLLGAAAYLADLAGIAARQINGGEVQMAPGSAALPALWTTGDRDTGAYFPAADALALVTAGLERLRVDANGRLGVGTTAPSGLLDVNDSKLRVRTAQTPASATAAGNAGEVCWDANFVYVCVTTNVWKRAALASW